MSDQQVNTQDGLLPFRSIDLDETEEEVSAVPAVVYFVRMHNLASSKRYVKFYNATAANTTVGSTTPTFTIPMEANSGETWYPPDGIGFSTALSVAATTGVADADTGAPGGNEVVINIGYAI